MLNAFLKAAKYAGLDDDQVVPAVLDHPGMAQAMQRFNEDMKRRAQRSRAGTI
jgi:ABC-type nitrate/sulfonate/bicarbonate transport system substrate-binding protein